MSPFLTWGDFHARSRLARSTISEEKLGTTRSLDPGNPMSQPELKLDENKVFGSNFVLLSNSRFWTLKPHTGIPQLQPMPDIYF